jgi:hypothetical protein
MRKLHTGRHRLLLYRNGPGILMSGNSKTAYFASQRPGTTFGCLTLELSKERLRESEFFAARNSLDTMLPNNALERAVRTWQGCAAGAGDIFAPAAHSCAFPRPAQLRGLNEMWLLSLHDLATSFAVLDAAAPTRRLRSTPLGRSHSSTSAFLHCHYSFACHPWKSGDPGY